MSTMTWASVSSMMRAWTSGTSAEAEESTCMIVAGAAFVGTSASASTRLLLAAATMHAGVKFYFRPFGKVGLVNEHVEVMRADAVDDLACALGLMDG